MTTSLALRAHNGVVYYQFPLLQSFPRLVHGIFTRQGGKSEGAYRGLNVSFSVGDDPQRVTENRELIRRALGLAGLHSLKQVHGKETVIISENDPPSPSAGPETRRGDILMTRRPGQGLLIKQADCQAVILYDPLHQAVSNLHCGWRGNVSGVIGEAVHKMEEVFGSDPAGLYAGIGPSLGPCCAQFIHYRKEFPPEYWSYQTRPFYFDLWRLSRDQLLSAGLREEHIQIAGICTVCRSGDFFSYRKEKITGRFATVVALC